MDILKNAKIENVSRRGFIKGLGISGGSLVLGVQFAPVMAVGKNSNKHFSPDVFVSIAPDG